MTAYSMENDREKFLASGMDNYLSKPIRANLLIRKVEECLQPEKISGRKKQKKEGPKKFEEIDAAIPAFDNDVIGGLKEMVGGDMLRSVFEDFRSEAEVQIENVLNAYHRKDVVAIQKELHTLKGNSGTIGLMRIHEITKEIEVPAKDGILDGFEKKFEILQEEFRYFSENFEEVCG